MSSIARLSALLAGAALLGSGLAQAQSGIKPVELHAHKSSDAKSTTAAAAQPSKAGCSRQMHVSLYEVKGSLGAYERGEKQGDAVLAQCGPDVQITVSLLPNVSIGSAEPTDLRVGRCTKLAAGTEASMYRLNPLKQRYAKAVPTTSRIPGMILEDLVNQGLALTTHESDSGMANYKACGDLREAAKQ